MSIKALQQHYGKLNLVSFLVVCFKVLAQSVSINKKCKIDAIGYYKQMRNFYFENGRHQKMKLPYQIYG